MKLLCLASLPVSMMMSFPFVWQNEPRWKSVWFSDWEKFNIRNPAGSVSGTLQTIKNKNKTWYQFASPGGSGVVALTSDLCPCAGDLRSRRDPAQPASVQPSSVRVRDCKWHITLNNSTAAVATHRFHRFSSAVRIQGSSIVPRRLADWSLVTKKKPEMATAPHPHFC